MKLRPPLKKDNEREISYRKYNVKLTKVIFVFSKHD